MLLEITLTAVVLYQYRANHIIVYVCTRVYLPSVRICVRRTCCVCMCAVCDQQYMYTSIDV